MGRPKSTALAVVPLDTSLAKVERAQRREQAQARNIRKIAKSSQKAYDEDWEAFEEWCVRLGIEPSKPEREDIGGYLEHLFVTPRADTGKPRKLTGIRRALTGVIHELRRRHGIDWINAPYFNNQLNNMEKDRADGDGESRRQATPLAYEDLHRFVGALSRDTIIDLRDRAVLLVGWMGGFRRSELAKLTMTDLERVSEGYRVKLKKAKGDQQGKRSLIALPTLPGDPLCPVTALEAWLKTAGIKEGPVFRAITRHGTARAGHLSGHMISKIVKRCARAVGIDDMHFSGHSLRRGIATYADKEGVALDEIRGHLRHADSKTTQEYIERSAIFARSIVAKLFAPQVRR